MPIYSHACPDCGHAQDHLLKIGQTASACPACGSAAYAKTLQAPAGFAFKGGGFYATDFKSPPPPPPASAPCSGCPASGSCPSES